MSQFDIIKDQSHRNKVTPAQQAAARRAALAIALFIIGFSLGLALGLAIGGNHGQPPRPAVLQAQTSE